jgi:hypothetical protein
VVHVFYFPPGFKDHIFCKCAPEKVLRLLRKAGDFTGAHWDPVKDLKGGFKSPGKLGKNKPTEMFRALAHQCGFANAEHFTSRSARRTGISLLGKSGLNRHVINAKARHYDTSTNALYNDPHESLLAAAAIALHYKPPGKSFAIHAILHTFCYSLFLFYYANVAQDKLKENLSPNFQIEQTVPPISFFSSC